MLTNDDLNKIQLLIVAGSNQVIKKINEVEVRVEQIEDDIKLLPTKEEHFSSMDKLMGEVQKAREEQEVTGGTLSQHNDRLKKLEERAGIPL